MTATRRIVPCLWFEGNALEAALCHASVIPNSSITGVHNARGDTPGSKEGDVLPVTVTLAGRRYLALNGNPRDTFNDAISLSVTCEDEPEVDRLWTALTTGGGRPVACGWLKDRIGLSWQIVLRQMPELPSVPDAAKAPRVMQATLVMVKLDVAAHEASHRG
jgi:predicted 3-demethylubiquinone-9 3-methyltransferase (glyoxalase superfamily)